MNIERTINYCLGLSYRELEDFAGENYKKVYYYMTERSEGEKVNTLLIGTIFTCVAADGKLHDEEARFIGSFVGGYSYEETFNIAGEFYNDEAQQVVKDLLNCFPSDIKEAYVNMCLAVLAVDKRITDYERCFLNVIL